MDNLSTAHARPFGVQPCVRQRLDLVVLLAEPAVDFLHQIRAVLIAAVYAALERQGVVGVNVGIAYDILQMPLHRVYPALCVQVEVNRVAVVRVAYGRVDVVCEMVVSDGLTEYRVAMFCE